MLAHMMNISLSPKLKCLSLALDVYSNHIIHLFFLYYYDLITIFFIFQISFHMLGTGQDSITQVRLLEFL